MPTGWRTHQGSGVKGVAGRGQAGGCLQSDGEAGGRQVEGGPAEAHGPHGLPIRGRPRPGTAPRCLPECSQLNRSNLIRHKSIVAVLSLPRDQLQRKSLPQTSVTLSERESSSGTLELAALGARSLLSGLFPKAGGGPGGSGSVKGIPGVLAVKQGAYLPGARGPHR